jgi:hypothetical protein
VTTQDSSHTANNTAVRSAKEKANERIGQWIKGKYRIDQLLGIGGMAAVYASTHRNGSRLALKILHTEFARDENVKGRFLREGYVANKVEHPGRVAILDDDETEAGEAFLVMELLEGETLQQVWKRYNRKVPPVEALRVTEAVLDTLGPFHDLNVIHRDLKPANIFVTNEGVVKLLDFGVAQLREAGAGEMTRAGTALGTPSYMSPEQAMGKSDNLDGRSDVFAMGATLYALLSGQRLHHGKSDNEAFILAATQPAPSVARIAPELPLEVIALVDKALQWDRRNRFANAHEMRDECRRVVRQLGGVPYGSGGAAPSVEVASPPPRAGRQTAPAPAAVVAAMREARPTPPPLDAVDARAPAAPPPPPAPPPEAPREALRKARATQVDLSTTTDRGARTASGDEEDPHAALKEFFHRFERALPSFRTYTLDHPESKGRTRALHRVAADALRINPDCLEWIVHPFCFVARSPSSDEELAVWEPGSPSDVIPYNLCAAGVEEIKIGPGVEEDEIYQLVRILLMDPNADPVNSDIKRALWEADFGHITYQVFEEVAAEGEEEKLLTEVAHLESMAREDLREVAAMAVSTNQTGIDALTASAALELSPIERTALSGRLSNDAEIWKARYLELVVEAYADAESRGDTKTLLEPVAQFVHQFLARDRYDQVFGTYFTLSERIGNLAQIPVPERRRAPAMPRELTNTSLAKHLFPPPILRQLLRALSIETLPAASREAIFNGLRAVLGALDASWFDDALAATNQLDEGESLELVMAYIERHVVGRESFVIQRLDQLKPALAQRCLALVTATKNPEALALLKPLMNSSNAALRCEAAALLTPSDEQLAKLLVEWLDANDPKLRMAALTTMKHHHVRAAGPGLVRVIEAFEGFRKRPLDEQRQVFESLYALNPARAETVLIQVVDQHGLMSDALLDKTRAIAAESLGKHADNTNPIEALENAARRRPWNTPDLRRVAGKAAESLMTRLGKTYSSKEFES